MTLVSLFGWMVYAFAIYWFGMWVGIRHERERRASRTCPQCERLIALAYGRPLKAVSVPVQPPAQS